MPAAGSPGRVRVGIIGARFAANVHAPAFRLDGRCELTGIASADPDSAARAAAHLGHITVHHNWRQLIEDDATDAVTIAVPPLYQPQIAIAALACGKPVFAEKPPAVTATLAQQMCDAAATAGVANMVDFAFVGIPCWNQARSRIEAGAIGRLRHIAVTWNVETRANVFGDHNWKTLRSQGGGTLFNFVSHVFHYLEWFGGPLAGLVVRHFSPADDSQDSDTFVVLAAAFRSGAAASASVSTAAFMGSGHRLEFYGEEGTLVLENPTSSYMRGFTLREASRRDAVWRQVETVDPLEGRESDDRVGPVSRLAGRFLDWITGSQEAHPNFVDGLRVQRLLEAAQDSQSSGGWVEIP